MDIQDLGLRHVVEDGLAILSGEGPPPARRTFVRRDLEGFARDVRDAIDAASRPLTTVGAGDTRRMRALAMARDVLGPTCDLGELRAGADAAQQAFAMGNGAFARHGAGARAFLEGLRKGIEGRALYGRQAV